MIRVRLEVDTYEHNFVVQRESEGLVAMPATERLDKLIRSAQASMNAALRARPES